MAAWAWVMAEQMGEKSRTRRRLAAVEQEEKRLVSVLMVLRKKPQRRHHLEEGYPQLFFWEAMKTP